MPTVLFYNFILFSSTFFVYAAEKERTQIGRMFFWGLAFLLVFIPSAIRYDIGTDYINYVEIFNNPTRLESYKSKEPLFYFINWFLRNIGAHVQWMFATFAFIFTAVAFKAYPRKQAWLLHFLVFSMLWFSSFNIIRQDIAVVFCLLATFFFFEKRYIWFFVLTLIGATFHQSALFITVAGFAALIPLGNQIKYRVAPYAFIGFIIFTYISMSVVLTYMEQILSLVGSKYAGYFSSAKHFIARDFGTGLGVLAKVLFSIYIIWNAKAFIKQNKNYWLLIVLVFAYAVGVVLADKIIIFGRMADTFVVAPIVAGYLLWQIPNNKQLNRLVLGAFLAFLILSFIKDGMGIETSYANPKRNPYQTIFSE